MSEQSTSCSLGSNGSRVAAIVISDMAERPSSLSL